MPPAQHRPRPRAVLGSWKTQPPENNLRHLWWLPPCRTLLPMMFKVTVLVCNAGTKSLWGWGESRGQTPTPPPLLTREDPGASRTGAQSPTVDAGFPSMPQTQQMTSVMKGQPKGQSWSRVWSQTSVSLSPKLLRPWSQLQVLSVPHSNVVHPRISGACTGGCSSPTHSQQFVSMLLVHSQCGSLGLL